MTLLLGRFMVGFEEGDFPMEVDVNTDDPDGEDTMCIDEDTLPDVENQRNNAAGPTVNENIDDPTDPAIRHNLQRLLDYINELYPVIVRPTEISHIPNPTTLQSSVLRDIDKLLPFQEHAPSRTMMQQDVSPFSLSMARTRTGVH